MQWLSEMKEKIRRCQIKAALQVNETLLLFYWDLGRDIAIHKMDAKWGSGFFAQLSRDLKNEFPEMRGFSVSNLKYIKRFYLFYSNMLENRQQVSDDFENTDESVKIQQSVSKMEQNFLPAAKKHTMDSQKATKNGNTINTMQSRQQVADDLPPEIFHIPWWHHITLMTKCKTSDEALFYVRKTIEANWSRSVLMNMLDTGLYEASGKAITNFRQTLPIPQGDLAQQTLKDPYVFDFLTMRKGYDERDLENALIENITRFLLELGIGFAYVGRQIRIQVGEEEFFIDLLFYHLKLRCFVVLELKTVKFEPSHLGQLNFYVTAVNEQFRHPNDGETIGLLICKTKDKVVAEYALKNAAQPLGISEYQLSRLLPKDIQSSLPTIDEIEAELGRKFKALP